VIVQELEALSTVTLEVVRSGGAFGRVRVSWEITGEHMQGEVTPTSGEVHTCILATPSLQTSKPPYLSVQ